jgi:hypothetical protein
MSTTAIEVGDRAAQIKAELLKLGKQVAAPSSNKIGTKGKLFTLPDGQSSPGPFNCVILDFAAVNSYYEGIYSPTNKAPPACFAVGQEIDSLVPSAKAPKPQGADCNTCPRSQWGTGQGGRGKACKNTRRLIVVPPNFTKDSAAMTLYVSPTGLKQWDAYVRRIVVEHQARPIDVVTKISFDPNQSYPTLKFEFVELNSQVQLAESVRALSQDVLFREPDVTAKAA